MPRWSRDVNCLTIKIITIMKNNSQNPLFEGRIWVNQAHNNSSFTHSSRNQEDENALATCLVENLCLLWAHRAEILSHPKMAFAEVVFDLNLLFVNSLPLRANHLGAVLEWLEKCPDAHRTDAWGGVSLLSSVVGSPMSGRNECRFVNQEGVREVVAVKPFRPVWESYLAVRADYASRPIPDEVYTLSQVVEVLKK